MVKEPYKWLAFALAVIVIITGSAFSLFAVQQEDARMREVLLNDARIAVQSIDPVTVEALSGSPADLNDPAYLALKERMTRIRAVDPSIRFVYLIGQRENGEFFFYGDSEPPESEDYSPPGQLYPEATALVRDAFSADAAKIGGPDTDRWGTWISSVVPVADPATGTVIAVYGMDIDARDWNQYLFAAALPGILGTLLALVLVAAFFIIHRRSIKEHERLGQSEKAYRTIFEHTGSATIQMEGDTTVSMVNGSFEQLTGYTREEIEGRRKWTEFVHPDDLPRMMEYHRLRRENSTGIPVQYEFRLITRDRAEKDILLSIGLIPGTMKTVATLVDLTEKKELERAVRKTEEQYQQLVELANDGIVIVKDGIIRRCNPGFAAITHYHGDELIGMPFERLVHSADREVVLDRHRRRLTGEQGLPSVYTFRFIWKDGTVRWVELNTRLVEWDEGPATLNIVRDVTDRKKIEDALILANEKLNLLSSVTRHDVLNQLLILKGYLHLSLQSLDDQEKTRTFIGREINSVATIEHQILFTKDYQDMGIRAPVWQDVGMILVRAKGALPMRDVAVKTESANVEVFADPLFEKVFYNLIDNALKHGGESLTTIRVSAHETEKGLAIIVEDNGSGIPDAEKPGLFAQGYGKHTGFGLFLSREILAITGMTIVENGVAGRGARFEITIPRGAYRFTDRKNQQSL